MTKRLMENELNFRNIVRSRDNWTCQKCGSVDYLQAHHIESRNGNNDNPDNGVTFCVYCHADEHPEVPRGLFISKVIQAEKDGCISAGKLAKEFNVNPRTIIRRAIKLGILKPMQKWMFNQKDVDILRNNYVPKVTNIKRVRKISITGNNMIHLEFVTISITVLKGQSNWLDKHQNKSSVVRLALKELIDSTKFEELQ